MTTLRIDINIYNDILENYKKICAEINTPFNKVLKSLIKRDVFNWNKLKRKYGGIKNIPPYSEIKNYSNIYREDYDEIGDFENELEAKEQEEINAKDYLKIKVLTPLDLIEESKQGPRVLVVHTITLPVKMVKSHKEYCQYLDTRIRTRIRSLIISYVDSYNQKIKKKEDRITRRKELKKIINQKAYQRRKENGEIVYEYKPQTLEEKIETIERNKRVYQKRRAKMLEEKDKKFRSVSEFDDLIKDIDIDTTPYRDIKDINVFDRLMGFNEDENED